MACIPIYIYIRHSYTAFLYGIPIRHSWHHASTMIFFARALLWHVAKSFFDPQKRHELLIIRGGGILKHVPLACGQVLVQVKVGLHASFPWHYAIAKNVEKQRNMFNVLIHETHKGALHAEIACLCQLFNGPKSGPWGRSKMGPMGPKRALKGAQKIPKVYQKGDPKSKSSNIMCWNIAETSILCHWGWLAHLRKNIQCIRRAA